MGEAATGMRHWSYEDDVTRASAGGTVATAFAETARKHAGRVALRWRDPSGSSFSEWTFADYADRVARAAAGLRARGIGHGDRIVVMMRNIPEFHVLDMAAVFVGATPISIYNSSAPEQIEYLVGHCRARLGVVENQTFLDRFASIRSRLHGLESIGVIDAEARRGADFTLADLLAHDPVDLAAAAGVVAPHDLATVIYTSGTTGPPKGVMLTHANIAWTVESLHRAMAFEDLPGKRLISYLPMAHIAERMMSHYQQAFLGFEVTTCPDPSAIGEYVRAVRPNFLFGVPRVWEKIHAGVSAALALDPDKQRRFAEGVETARPIVQAKAWGTATAEQLALLDFLDKIAFRQVRQLLGLDQLELALTGAAPIPAERIEWFRSVGVPLAEIYGMSESSGPMNFVAQKVKPGSVGPAIPGCEIKLGEDGEVMCRGGNVFAGYLDDPEKTAETLDYEGWLHSGDIGTIDADGYYRIVDRKKELIITAGGKNVSPANLESSLKMIPLVGQACAIGDGRPFVSALLVLDPDAARAWASGEGVAFTSLADLARHPRLLDLVHTGLEQAMSTFNNAERVKKVCILADEWLPDSDCLTPTAKLKRRGVHARYAAEIEALYR